MTKRRRLTDLYVTGRELTIDDGQGGETVWLQKLNDLDHETALRKAGAARAVVMTHRNEPESDDYKSAYSDMAELDNRDFLIDLVTREENVKRLASAEAELAAEDEWSEDGYLQGLHDSWNGGLKDRYATDPEDPEAKRVFGELKRFSDAVTSAVDEQIDALKAAWADRPDSELFHEATLVFLAQRATNAFLREFERCELWLATRKADKHTDYYFASREEIDQLQPQVYDALRAAYTELIVDPTEGKDSPGIPASSPSSEPSVEEAPAPPSGPAAATA